MVGPVQALKLIESRVVEYQYDSKGALTNMIYSDVNDEVYDGQADCHGYTFTDNGLWINDSEVNGLLEGDGYLETTEEKSDIVIYSNMGEVVHSAVNNKDGTWTNNAGIMQTETVGSADEALRTITSDGRKFYSSPKEALTLNYLGDGTQAKDGYKLYSINEITESASTEVLVTFLNKCMDFLNEAKGLVEDYNDAVQTK